jgi:phosphoribosylglycinamide formyltransferase-1
MFPRKFFLVAENDLSTTYLVWRWLDAFAHLPNFGGVVLRAEAPRETWRHSAQAFHRTYAGVRSLDLLGRVHLAELYPAANEAAHAMVRQFGITPRSVGEHPRTRYIGNDLNGERARRWLTGTVREGGAPFLFVFLDRLFAPWWMRATEGFLVNVHSAVLPFARGMHAIENIAATVDVARFTACAGATVHFVDEGIDTGPIIHAAKMADPLAFESIWDMKGATFDLAFRLLVDTADGAQRLRRAPVGAPQAPRLRGPAYRRKDFTAAVRARAAEGYLAMRAASLVTADPRALRPSPSRPSPAL